MEYSVLGRTGRKVSRIGFGGAVIGLKDYLEKYNPLDSGDRRIAQQAIEKALELGINYFDTAPGYGSGQSEEIFGEVLGGLDQEIFLATKVSMAAPEVVRKSLEDSLHRLRRDYVDLLQIHGTSYSAEDVERVCRQEGILQEMKRLKKEGLVRHLGFTSEDNNRGVYDFLDSGDFDVIQICYNLLFQHPYEPSRPFGTLYEAEKKEMGIVTMRTTTSGTFQKWVQMVNPDNTFDYAPALIQFVLSNPLVDVALIGMRTPEMVMQNVKLCEDTAGRIDLTRLHERYV